MDAQAYLQERAQNLRAMVADAQTRLDALRGGLAEVEYAMERIGQPVLSLSQEESAKGAHDGENDHAPNS